MFVSQRLVRSLPFGSSSIFPDIEGVEASNIRQVPTTTKESSLNKHFLSFFRPVCTPLPFFLLCVISLLARGEV